nr:ATP-binding protein [Kineosphaera limosa]
MEALGDTPVVTLQGSRQTGKSTLAAKVGEQLGARIYTMDDAATRGAAQADPTGFIQALGGGPVVLDEVQRTPEVILPIKASIDRDRRPGRFLLTGSADLLRMPGAQDSLAGRAETLTLNPLSQGELTGRHDDLVSALWARLTSLTDLTDFTTAVTRADLVHRACAGGLPEATARTDRRRSSWFEDYAERLVRRDAQDLGQTPPARLRAALDLVAANQAGELVMAHIARHVGIAETTARSYVDRLRSLFLIQSIAAWSRSPTSRQIKKPKALVTDSGLAAHLADLTEEELLSPLGVNQFGPLLEGFVAAELLRQQTWSASRFRLSHYRESGGQEVDLLITGPGGAVVGIEVKATVTVTAHHFAGLRRCAERIGDDFKAGIVMYAGDQAWSFGAGLLALPVSALWELQA